MNSQTETESPTTARAAPSAHRDPQPDAFATQENQDLGAAIFRIQSCHVVGQSAHSKSNIGTGVATASRDDRIIDGGGEPVEMERGGGKSGSERSSLRRPLPSLGSPPAGFHRPSWSLLPIARTQRRSSCAGWDVRA